VTIAIGGQCRNVGKTTLACHLLRAFADRRWTAVKISRHAHGLPPGEFALERETGQGLSSDTARYLSAGAAQAYFLRAPGDTLPAALTALEAVAMQDLLIESNSYLGSRRPDVYLLVLDPARADVKRSAREYGPQANAVIVPSLPCAVPLAEGKPCFALEDWSRLAGWIRARAVTPAENPRTG
jgi:hypothetical protein